MPWTSTRHWSLFFCWTVTHHWPSHHDWTLTHHWTLSFWWTWLIIDLLIITEICLFGELWLIIELWVITDFFLLDFFDSSLNFAFLLDFFSSSPNVTGTSAKPPVCLTNTVRQKRCCLQLFAILYFSSTLKKLAIWTQGGTIGKD